MTDKLGLDSRGGAANEALHRAVTAPGNVIRTLARETGSVSWRPVPFPHLCLLGGGADPVRARRFFTRPTLSHAEPCHSPKRAPPDSTPPQSSIISSLGNDTCVDPTAPMEGAPPFIHNLIDLACALREQRSDTGVIPVFVVCRVPRARGIDQAGPRLNEKTRKLTSLQIFLLADTCRSRPPSSAPRRWPRRSARRRASCRRRQRRHRGWS